MIRPVALAAVIAGALGCAAARPALRAMPDALSSSLTWTPAERVPSPNGAPVDTIPIAPGAVARFETNAPLRVGQRVGPADVWSEERPVGGVIVVRASAFASAFLLDPGKGGRVHVGSGSDPGFAWLALESRALAWADGPAGSEFPALAPPERIDHQGLRALDAAITSAVDTSANRETAAAAARAVRRVVALRVVRALRPMMGFPYVLSDEVRPLGTPRTRMEEETELFEVSAEAPLALEVEGPAMLNVLARAVRGPAYSDAKIEITENGHERAISGGGVPGAKAAELSILPRALVHVPPGKHAYRVTASGPLVFAHAIASRMVIRMEDSFAGAKDEVSLLKTTERTCDGASPALCAMAMALAGKEIAGDAIADMLARGGPREPLAAMTLDASRGDRVAFGALIAAAEREVDEGVREAAVMGELRGRMWAPAAAQESAPTWLLVSPDTDDAGGCASSTPMLTEITGQPMNLIASPWRGGRAISLLAFASCTDAPPIGLEVDGEPLRASPGAARASWRVAVRGERARVRRTDGGAGRVYAVSGDCGAPVTTAVAPVLASTSPHLTYDGTRAPGVDVWVKQGRKSATLTASNDKGRAEITVTVEPGMVAVDEQGTRWSRAARVPLPTWAASGVRIEGADDVAVRAIVRVARDNTVLRAAPGTGVAEILDEARLMVLTRAIATTKEPRARGQAYLARAIVLARAGVTRGAREDARAARGLGARGAKGEDPLDVAATELRAAPPRPPSLKSAAYGLEPDFDAGPRCTPRDGPRAKLLATGAAMMLAPVEKYDPTLASRAAAAVKAAPLDPRGQGILARALSHSRWRPVREAEGRVHRVLRPRAPHEDASAVGADGLLRGRAAFGEARDAPGFVTVTAARPAKAMLPDASGHLEIVCAARAPAEAHGPCPLAVTVAGSPLAVPPMESYGRTSLSLPAHGGEAELAVSLPPAAAEWIALLRVIFDKPVKGTRDVEGVGNVLETPSTQLRFLVRPGAPLTMHLAGPGVARVEALPDGDAAVDLRIATGDREEALPANGEPLVVVLGKEPLSVRAHRGVATVTVAERVEGEDEEGEEAATATAEPGGAFADPQPAKDTATRSVSPLDALTDSLGTLIATTSGTFGTFREGAHANRDPDAAITQALTYGRRIESIGLWVALGGLVSAREGAPTYGGTAILYEEYNGFRATATMLYFGQQVAGADVSSLRPRGFLEYSWRATKNFFVLPRLGYDGYYTNLVTRPTSSVSVDDSVYNAFRFHRNSFAYAQGLFWLVPYLNEILYLRERATVDVTNGAMSHVSSRVGAFVAPGMLDTGVFLDGTYYFPGKLPDDRGTFDVSAAAKVALHLWAIAGSLDVVPSLQGAYRANDGGFQVALAVDLLASYRRGHRDLSSLVLAFPEQLGGGVPWRDIGGRR
jgi:hypothetical protein